MIFLFGELRDMLAALAVIGAIGLICLGMH
jgi:hypothetical protein